MSCKYFLTLSEALAALDETLCNEDDKNKYLVIAPPDVAVLSDQESVDEKDLVQDCFGLSDAVGEIEIHRKANEPKIFFFSVSSLALKTLKKLILLGAMQLPAFLYLSTKNTAS